MQGASEYYQRHLDQCTATQQYLKDRGLTKDTIARFGIGYAPKKQSALLNASSSKLLYETGLANRQQPKFQHRLMFPIHDRSGKPIAFGGRALASEQTPKYLNSKETEWFHKQKTLYGFFQAKQSPELQHCVFVTEGYMDVCMLAEHGVPNAVATLGTAISEHQLRMLKQICKKIIFCFDGDTAGQRAANRAFERALPYLMIKQNGAFMVSRWA